MFVNNTDPFPGRILGATLRRPRLVLSVVVAMTLLLGSGLMRLDLRTDGAAIHPHGNETIDRTLGDRDTFDDPEQAIVLLTTPADGLALESPAGFSVVVRLQRSLEALESVNTTGVRSLATLLDPDPSVGIAEIDPFLDHIPPDDQWLESKWLERLRSSPVTQGLLLSASGRAAAFYVQVAPGHSRDDLINELENWIAGLEALGNEKGFELRLTGPVAAEVMLGRTVLRDLFWLVPIMLIVIAVLLFVSLGTLGGVLIPFAEVLMVLVWTLGAMGHLGIPITLVTTILPIVLMTMAVTDEIHLLERFQARLASDSSSDEGADPRNAAGPAMLGAISDVGRPIVLTSLTTAIGFLSFLSASMDPIRHFGLFTAIGILIAMLLSFSFVPALAVLLPTRLFEPASRRAYSASRAGATNGLWPHERLIVRRSGTAAAVALLLVIATAPGMFRLFVQDSWIDNFDPASDLVSADREFNSEFWGSYRLDVALESDEERFFQYHDGLALMERVRDVALAGPHVTGVESHLIPFGEVAKYLGEDAAVPLSSLPHPVILRLVVLTWSARDEAGLDQLLAWGGQKARARLYVDSPDHVRGQALIDYLERELPAVLEPKGVRFHLSGELAVAVEVVDSIVENQLRSMAWALFGVTLLLLGLTRSLAKTALLVAPLAAALPVLLGAMGYLGVSLGIATSMFSALALGVGVDFALHFQHAYGRSAASGLGHRESLEESLRTSGRAIRWNAAVLGLGFLVLTGSSLKPNHSLGLLLAAAIATCYAMTLLLLPALLGRVRGRS